MASGFQASFGLLSLGSNDRMQRMKTWACMACMAAIVVAGCQQAPPTDSPTTEGGISEKPRGYQALPGMAATSATPSDTATAFEFAAASLATPSDATPRVQTTEKRSEAPRVAAPALPRQIRLPDNLPEAPPIPDPRPVSDDDEPLPAADSSQPDGSAAISASSPEPSERSSGYAVQVTNGTNGRLFVEVKDDSGNIFPFGFMYAGQRIASQPQENRPIQGNLQVIIRDPDQRGAPELRRYRVAPPAAYDGKTVGVTILPGGRYRASVDGKVYYKSPDPRSEALQN